LNGFILAYDAGCGPCTRFRRLVEFFDARRRMTYISLSEADSEGMLDGVRPSLRHGSFHLLLPDGHAMSGAAAIPTLVSLLPGGGIASGAMVSVPGGTRLVGFVYDVLSRLHDKGSCSYRPGVQRADSDMRTNRLEVSQPQRTRPISYSGPAT